MNVISYEIQELIFSYVPVDNFLITRILTTARYTEKLF